MEVRLEVSICYEGALWDVEHLEDYKAQLRLAREIFGMPPEQRLRIERVRMDGQRSVVHPGIWSTMSRRTSIEPPIFHIVKEGTVLKAEPDSDIEILCTPPKRVVSREERVPRYQMITPPPSERSVPPVVPKSTHKPGKHRKSRARNQYEDAPYTPSRRRLAQPVVATILGGRTKKISLRPRRGVDLTPRCSRCQTQKTDCNASGDVACYQCRKAHVACSFTSID
ncbi:hypothetical protein FRC19_011850 [Serendipita sp. 401]|nr:hypothetical protein FRC19_011850 [Serendipita sp. 401]